MKSGLLLVRKIEKPSCRHSLSEKHRRIGRMRLGAEAARRLNLAPAALAQRLRTLEQDLGQMLLSRVGRTVRPTASGLDGRSCRTH
jgi:hypothetical protein